MKLRKALLAGTIAAATLAAVLAPSWFAGAQSPGVNSPFGATWSIPIDSIKRTYGRSITQLSLPSSTITDIWQICGTASATVRVTNVRVNVRATAVQPIDVVLVKRSGQDTGGTVTNGEGYGATSQTGIPFDSGFAASTAWVAPYVAVPTTLGTVVGNVASWLVYAGNLTTGIPSVPFEYLVDRPSSAIVLRGATQCLAVNLSNGVVPGGLANVQMEWTEE